MASSPSGAVDVTLLLSTRIHLLFGMKISSIAYHHTTHNHVDSSPHPHLSLMLLHFLCTRVHTHPLLPTSNTPSPMAPPSRASLPAVVHIPNLIAVVSLWHQNDRLPYHCTTPAWQNDGDSMLTTTGAMAPTPTSPRTPGSSVNPTCHNQQCGYVIKYLMAMGTPSVGNFTVGALQHERLQFYLAAIEAGFPH